MSSLGGEDFLCFFSVDGFGFSTGGALCSTGAACVSAGAGCAAAIAGPTVRLFKTCLTPGIDAACLLAASFCASLSTVPLRVTTPSADCTVSCFEAKPESWLNLL